MLFQYALEVESTHSISQAAKNLYLSQPNLSKCIKDLEAQLGYPIFERSSTGVSPTPEGRAFLESARRVMAEVEKMQRGKSADALALRVCLPRSSYLCAGFLRFMAELDMSAKANVSMRETNALAAINGVSRGTCGLSVIRYPLEYEPYFLRSLKENCLESELLLETEYLALLSKEHPLAGRSVIPFQELRKGVEIAWGDVYVPYLSAQEGVREREDMRAQRTVSLFDRASGMELLRCLREAYIWAAPVPADVAERYSLVQRRCDLPDHRFKDMLIYPRGRRFTALEQKLILRLLEAKAEASFLRAEE